MPHQWKHDLAQLEQQQMLRNLRTIDGAQGPRVFLEGRQVVLLCSNNYLGLANHPLLVEALCRETRSSGVGSGASRLVSGSMRAHQRLEERLADFKGTEAALLFNSGYAANTGILQGLFGPDDVIFSDVLNHASIVDGCRLSAARVLVYPHGDTEALEEMVRREQPARRGRFLIVTDGVFSMDGNIAPLAELARLKETYDALLMVDDAHGTGVLGEQGRGSAELCGCSEAVDLQMGTLGKGLGCAGAYLAATRTVVDSLINHCRPFIFSTSLPPGVLAAAGAALEIVAGEEGRKLRLDLLRKTDRFSTTLRQAGLDLLQSRTQIVPVLTRDPEPTMKASVDLLEEGYFISGIRPPTVPVGSCRLRITLTADQDDVDLEGAAAVIRRLLAPAA